MKVLVLWFGTLGVLLSLLGLMGATGEWSLSGGAESSTYSEPMDPDLPTATESQAETFPSIPALTS